MGFIDWLNSCPKSDFLFAIFFLGVISSMLYDICISLCDYFHNRAWRVRDLEFLIANNLKTDDVLSSSEKKLVAECSDIYNCYTISKAKREKIFNKIKSFFKRHF